MKRWLLRVLHWIEIPFPLPAPVRSRAPFDEG